MNVNLYDYYWKPWELLLLAMSMLIRMTEKIKSPVTSIINSFFLCLSFRI